MRKYFTIDGYQEFNKLLDYGQGELLPQNMELELVKINCLFCLRSLPMTFSFRGQQEPFTEKVNLLFNLEGKIENVTFALSTLALEDICENPNFSDEDKGEIIYFMELYKTAYCLKDISFLENIFTEDVRIIAGYGVKKILPIMWNDFWSNLAMKKFSISG
ncbi:MAG: hypothetical protein K9N06_02900 [Candidatus Cloacimonetes bacterium]|nr:hypothetical protein [Candidatus Cloacimonadota bacterium]